MLKQNRQVPINLQSLSMGLLDSYPVPLSWPSLMEAALIANGIKWQQGQQTRRDLGAQNIQKANAGDRTGEPLTAALT